MKFIFSFLVCCGIVLAQPALDIYGGVTSVACTNTGQWHTQEVSGRWMFCDPLGHGYFAFAMEGTADAGLGATITPWGANITTTIGAKYSGGYYSTSWGNLQVQRLQSWGFNSIGPYGAYNAMYPTDVSTKVPYTNYVLRPSLYGQNLNRTGITSVLPTPLKTWVYGMFTDLDNFAYPGSATALEADYYDPKYYTALDYLLGNDEQLAQNVNGSSSARKDYFLFITTDEADQTFSQNTGPGTTFPPSGKTHDHGGWRLAIVSPLLSANPEIGTPGGLPYAYTDNKVYIKTAWANYLCGDGAGCTALNSISATAARSGTTVTLTASGHLFEKWETISIDGCSDATFDTVQGTGAIVTSTTSSTVTLTLSGAGTSATGCNVFSGPNYHTISNLNTAWGTSGFYTTFFSSGTVVTGESLGTGNGSTVTFSKTLANTHPAPFSLQVMQASAAIAGDACDAVPFDFKCFSTNTSGGLTGPTVSSGSVNYSTGVMTVTFSSAPPAGAITVNYVNNGWGRGTGILDEDGQHTTWIGSGGYPNGHSAFNTDVDGMLFEFSKYWMQTSRAHVMSYFNSLISGWQPVFVGPDALFYWDCPSYPSVLKAAGQNLDAMIVSGYPLPQTALDTIESNAGDIPLINISYASANADSELHGNADNIQSAPGLTTQAGRAAWYYALLDGATSTACPATTVDSVTFGGTCPGLLNATYAATGTHPYIGELWFKYFDNNNESSWGVITSYDNAYDTNEDVFTNAGHSRSVACSGTLSALGCGGEDQTYGNLTGGSTGVIAAHNQALTTLAGASPPTLSPLLTVTVPQKVYLLGSPINAAGTNAHHPQYFPDGSSLTWEQSRPASGGAYDVVVANADGSSPVIITQTTFAKANLPGGGSGTCGNPTPTPDSAGLIIQCRSAASVLNFSQANPGVGSDNSLWYIDKAGTSKIVELAGDIPCSIAVNTCIAQSQTQGGFLQFRMSLTPGADGNYFFFGGRVWSWFCSSAIGGLCQRLEKFDYTQVGGTPALTGTGFGNGIEGNAQVEYASGGTVPGTGAGICTVTASGGTLGLNASGTLRYSGGAISSGQIINWTFHGNSYTALPTVFNLSGTGCSGSITVTGTGAFDGTDFAVCVGGGSNPSNCFTEGGTTDPAENPAHKMYFSQFDMTPVQGQIYEFDLSNTGAGPVLVGPSDGWNEMPTFTPFYDTLCFDSSHATPDVPAVGSSIPLDLYCQPPGGSFYGATFFNTPGNPMFYNPGGNFTSFGVFSFSTDYTHVAAEIFNNRPLPFGFANVYILPVGPQTSRSFGQVGSFSKTVTH